MNSGTLSFSLFHIPIVVRPVLWMLLAFLGGVFYIDNIKDVSHVLLFMVAGFICLLFHELGHAFASRSLCRAAVSIELNGFGGLTTSAGGRTPSRWQFFAIVFAGPLMGLAPALFVLAFFALLSKSLMASLATVGFLMYPDPSNGLLELAYPVLGLTVASDNVLLSFISSLCINILQISFAWTLLNLLPIFPLDGGKLLGTLINNFKWAAIVGMVVSVLVILLFLKMGMIYNTLIAAYLAYLNWQHWQAFKQSS